MDEGKLLASSYFLLCLVSLVGSVNNVVYLLLLKRLGRLLKERWPEKLADLGEPFYRFPSLRASLSSSSLLRLPGSTRAWSRFILNPGIVEDAEVSNTLRRVRMFLIGGFVGAALMGMSILLLFFALVRVLR